MAEFANGSSRNVKSTHGYHGSNVVTRLLWMLQHKCMLHAVVWVISVLLHAVVWVISVLLHAVVWVISVLQHGCMLWCGSFQCCSMAACCGVGHFSVAAWHAVVWVKCSSLVYWEMEGVCTHVLGDGISGMEYWN